MKSGDLAKPDTKKASTIPSGLSMSELAEVLSLSKMAICKKSDKESWLFEEIPVRGGYQKVFSVKDLPPDIRKKVRIHFGELPAEFAECVPAEFDQEKIRDCSQEWDSALDWQKERARARLEILNALDRHRAQSKKSRRAALDQFVELHRNREVLRLEPCMYDEIDKVSRSQLYEWESGFREHGIAG